MVINRDFYCMLEKTFKFTGLQMTKNRCELSAMNSEYVEITPEMAKKSHIHTS